MAGPLMGMEMLQNKSQKKDSDAVASPCQKALAETSKALKALSFYPENHPLRRQILDSAFEAVTALISSAQVTFVVQRNGFSLPGSTLENNPATRALAQELFVRELQRVTFLPGISRADFCAFLSLLTLPPQKVAEEGGMGELLAKRGILTVMVNQIDISAVYTSRNAGTAAEDSADGADAVEDEPVDNPPEQGRPSGTAELSIEELIAALESAKTDEAYRQLCRMLLDKAQPLKQERCFDYLFKVVMVLVGQSAEEGRSAASRDSARSVVQQLCLGEMTVHLLDHLEDAGFRHTESVYRIVELLGAAVVEPVMTRLLAARSKAVKKTYGVAVVRIGAPALPSLLAFLKDGRWHVVYTAVSILGEMGNRRVVKELALALNHPDTRVRMATIRVLAKLGGSEATALLLSLLEAEDQATALQAITWLGHSRNQAALQPLIELVQKRDLLGKSQALKKEAVIAIGRIAERRSLDLLFELVTKRGWLFPRRAMELKVAALQAIAAVGGEQAVRFLKEVAGNGGEVGRAAGAAVEGAGAKE